jgi:dephospho-CoA kinase
MILIGLTGGVGTGKSAIAKMFKRCGAVVIDADALARKVVTPGKPAWRKIVRRFGTSVLNRDKTIDRHALGHIVFHDRTKLRLLERIIHPQVAREQVRLTNAIARKHRKAVVIYEVPLLFEAGVDKRVDKVVVVTADRETQIARLKQRNGLSRAEALRRIKSQLPLAMKVRHADIVLNGTCSRASLGRQVRALYTAFRQSA